MTVSKETENEIRRLYFAEHWPLGTVASQLGVHEDVVRRVVGILEPRPSRKRRPRLIDPFRDFIAETLERYPKLRSTRLYDMIRERGYTGSARTLRAYVTKVRPRARREAFLRTEPLIAEQGQIDWAHAGQLYVPGGKRPVWLFVMVLAWSRAMWGEFVFELTAASLRRSLVRAMSFFGGSPRQWLFDNAKAVVVERHGDAVRFHPQLLDLAGVNCAQLQLCAPRKPHQKGKVERAIRYLRDRFLMGRSIHNIPQGNRALWRFLDETAHARSHPVQSQRTVQECLDEERGRLLPLPPQPPSIEQVLPVTVGKDAFVRFDSNRYSVPPDLAEQAVTLVADDETLRVLKGKEPCATHQRCWGKEQTIELAEHRQALVDERKAAAASKGRDRLRTAVPQIDTLIARWVEMGRNIGNLTGQTIRLLDLYGEELLRDAVAVVLERGTHDPGALAVVCEQRRRATRDPAPISVELGAHVPDRDVVPHSLEKYDAKLKDDDNQ